MSSKSKLHLFSISLLSPVHPPTIPLLLPLLPLSRLYDLREVHRAHEADLRRMEVDMDSSRTSLENLEDSSADRQLRFYRATTAYVQNLVECLREKVRSEGFWVT